ncbi:MAG: hypothetical protein Q7R79_00320 [bacterium]|nr:hypothetical protein [bacterium]
MEIISVPKPKNPTLVAVLETLYQTFKGFNGEKVRFDVSKVKWKSPLLLLPMASYIHETDSDFTLNSSDDSESYLKCIRFPKGVNSVSSFEEMVQREKTYIPIGVLKREGGKSREQLESLFIAMVKKVLGSLHPGVHDAISYPITELVTNVMEHSHATEGWIFGQYYPKMKYLDICIVDRGRGLSASYKEEMNAVYSDEQAIEEAMKGHSTKPNKERGYGIRTSKRLVCEAMGGEFVFLSGSAVLFSNATRDRLAQLPDFHWKGTIVAYRIPQPTAPIDIYGYLE